MHANSCTVVNILLTTLESCLRAKFALDNNLVINLTDIEIPVYSTVILSYGPGWIPCPIFNPLQYKVDGHNAANKLGWTSIFKDSVQSADLPMDLLKKEVTTPCLHGTDPIIKQVSSSITNYVDNANPPKMKSNMNKLEKEGLDWLKAAVKDGKIAITSADKGGAILVVTPDIIKNITREKVHNTSQYTDIGSLNPLPDLSSQLDDHWISACKAGYVSNSQAKKTVGVIMKSEEDKKKMKKDKDHTISTSDSIKPGIPYGYPLLKVHKLTNEDLASKIIPPSRFVSDLSVGVTARADKFIVWKWLGPLARDYATDLVKDSTAALILLDALEKSGKITSNSQFISFGIDVVSLYDSLRHSLVMEALDDAIETCRPDWDESFCIWLKESINLSFESAVVKFEENWYKVNNGVPTGGIPSVDLGNISVFYVLKKLVFNDEMRPKEFLHFVRFVDDMSGVWEGTMESFEEWFTIFKNASVPLYGLDFTCVLTPVNQYSQFLDINFKFSNGVLTTDIFRKPTDANRYLEFSSSHPRHTFRSVVYSQGIRYRRIINNDGLLSQRLDELQDFFTRSSYPRRLVTEVLSSIRQLPRVLEYNVPDPSSSANMTPWTVTYGPGFNRAKEVARGLNESIKLSDTWKEESEWNTPLLKVVAKRAPNLKDTLFKRKSIALSSSDSATIPCTPVGAKRKRGAPCQCCQCVSNSSTVSNNGVTVSTVGGTCKTNNIIYAATCTLCNANNVYIGKTVSQLRERVNGHRSSFYDTSRKFLANDNFVNFLGKLDIEDVNILGVHLVVTHRKYHEKDFNSSYIFDVVSTCVPSNLRFTEQFYIDKLNTLMPYGLNQINSIGSLSSRSGSHTL